MQPETAHAMCEAPDPVAAFCADTTLWGDLAGNTRLVDAVRHASERVSRFVTAHTGVRPTPA
jgi:D-arabinitol 4-dehydrogenase